MKGRSLLWNNSLRRHPAGNRRLTRREGDERFAKATQRSQSGPGATAALRARPVDSPKVIPALEFKSVGRRFSGMEKFLAKRCVPAAMQRTKTCGMHDCAINRARRSTSTSSWYTRSPERLNVCRSATKWKAELPSTPTETSE